MLGKSLAILVVSPRERSGTTLIARLFAEFLRLSGENPLLFDTDAAKVGQKVGDALTVRPYEELERVVSEEDVVVGVLAVPTAAAQRVADDLVEAGVKVIFNYSEALLQVPPEVTVHTSSPAVDLLYALYFYLT